MMVPSRSHRWFLMTSAVVPVLGVLLAWVLLPIVLGIAVEAGHLIPQDDLESDYIVAWIWAIVLTGCLWLAPIKSDDKRTLMWGWGLRVVAVLIAMLAYESHYGLDAYDYFGSR